MSTLNGVSGAGARTPAVAGHPLDQPDLPQRLGAVEALREEPPGELLERLLVRRLGQRRVADVVARVEVRVVGPDGTALPVRNVREALAVARHEMQAADD